ncbi:MAG TPA: hypothetical protein VG095_01500, partial [Chthoniobacterales bacterium]|nr:hypothetical protein [Chthoniobacterales bacterium]
MILAALGVVHLFSRGADLDRSAAQREATPSETPAQASPAPVADQPHAHRPALAITDVTPSSQRLRDGSTLVSVRIGVAPQPAAKTGEVEIRVFFFDVTRDGELRPTEAEVAYEWLTPVRDWSDPSPKFLQATCLRPRRARSAAGFVVRVYSDGKLQDERGEPEQILAVLRANAAPPQTMANATPPLPTTMIPSEVE